MKKMLLIGLLLVSHQAMAEKLLIAPAGNLCVGQRVQIDKSIYVLSTEAKCPLPIVNAEHMRLLRANNQSKEGLSGCWGKALGNNVLFIWDDGRSESMPISVFAEVEPDSSGSGVVTGSPAQANGWNKCT